MHKLEWMLWPEDPKWTGGGASGVNVKSKVSCQFNQALECDRNTTGTCVILASLWESILSYMLFSVLYAHLRDMKRSAV
jgi:hypothetical protein